MSNLSVFNFDTREVRTLIDAATGEPWFVAADVCAALELDDTSKAVSRLDDDEKGTNTVPTPGGAQEMITINESGLYSLILTSRKPEAKRFKKWVTSEVLPTIRKTGGYASEHTLLKDQLLAAKDQIIDLQRQIMLSMQERKTKGRKKENTSSAVEKNTEKVFKKVVAELRANGVMPSWRIVKALKMSKSEAAPYLKTMQANGTIVVTSHKPISGMTRHSVMLA